MSVQQPPALSSPVMRVTSDEEEGASYNTLNGQNQAMDIKIAANPGSVMAMKRNSEMRSHQPTYAYDEPSDENGVMVIVLTILSYFLIALTFPISFWFCFRVSTVLSSPRDVSPLQTVNEYERAVIFRLGRIRKGGARGPGLRVVIPCIDTFKCVDLRTGAFDVPPQEILTRDSVSLLAFTKQFVLIINSQGHHQCGRGGLLPGKYPLVLLR